MKSISKLMVTIIVMASGAVSVVAASDTSATSAKPAVALTGQINVDGSATVFPLSEGIAEEFQKQNTGVRVKVAASGTGGGFQKFCRGETDITGASRPIEKSELELCAKNQISYIELPVAYDGLAVVVNRSNTAVKSLTVAQLKSIYEPDSKVKTWGQLGGEFAKNIELKDKEIKIFGPGPEHGTFDYFTKVINGKEKAIRTDFTAANPDVLVSAVAGNKYAIGYFGYAYYFSNQSKLGLVAIDGGKGPTIPDASTIASGKYTPLSRPIFIYANEKVTTRPEIAAFVSYYILNSPKIASEVGYVSLGDELYKMVSRRFDARITGTLYGQPSKGPDTSLKILLGQANSKIRK